ncbi:hypothetical protein JCM6882_008875 [Rhodosporidiobolus microsporus]
MSGPAHSAPTPYGVNVWDVPMPPVEQLKLYHGWLPDFDGGRSKRCAGEVLSFNVVVLTVSFEQARVAGGAIFADDASTEMVGSWILFRAESLADARKKIEQDIYTTGGAWDMSKAVISPIAQAPLAEAAGKDFAKYLDSASK